MSDSSSSDEEPATQDDKEALAWRAVELRRRIENRKRAAGLVKPSGKSKIHPVVMAETREIRSDIILQDSRYRAAANRPRDQYVLTRSLRNLKKHLQGSTKAVRAKTYALNNLEDGLKTLRRDIHDDSHSKTFTLHRIEAELNDCRQQVLDERDCAVCGRKLTVELHERHEKFCQGRLLQRHREEGVKENDSFEMCSICFNLVRHGRFQQHQESCTRKHDRFVQLKIRGWTCSVVPRPPENVRLDLKATTHDTIVIQWDLPVFTGAAIIYDYEISYSKCELRESRDKMLRTFTTMPSVCTSHWILKQPVAQGRFCLEKLQGGTEYGRIFVRARTIHGMSRPSNEIELVKTMDVISPSPPLYFGFSVVTDSSIHLTWDAPFDSGGSKVVEYEIRYKGQESDSTSLDLRVTKEVSFVVRTRTNAMSYTLKELRADAEYVDFQVQAVNELGMVSAASDLIRSITTKRKGMESALLEQLDTAINHKSSVIDSDFYNGFVQRYDRKYFIKLLSTTIKETNPELRDRVDEMLPSSEEETSSSDDDDSSSTSSSLSSSSSSEEEEQVTPEERMTAEEKIQALNKRRRQQFHYRIGVLERKINDARYNISWCKDQRAELMGLLHSAEKRMHDKQGEFERARNFSGSEMDSMALHGKLQRFTTASLIQALEEEMDIERYYIADTKQEIIKVEKFLKTDETTLERRKSLLSDRKEALKVFEKELLDAERAKRCLKRLSAGPVYTVLAGWKRYVQDRRDQRALMDKVFSRIDLLQYRAALDKWKLVNTQYDQLVVCPNGVIGVGGKSLALANRHRSNIEAECNDLLGSIRKTNKILIDASKTNSQQSLASASAYTKEEAARDFFKTPELRYWRQGDASMDLGDYAAAVHSYEKQFDLLPESKLAERGRLYARIGDAMLKLNDRDHALLKYRRACMIADRISDRVGESLAYRGIGDLYRATRAWTDSIDAYERALLAYDDLGDSHGQESCLRGLEIVYSMSSDDRNAKICRERADKIKFEMENKLNNMDTRLDEMRRQLLSTTAQPKRTIVLERVRAIVPRLRAQRIDCKLRIVESKRQREAFIKLVEEKKGLIEEGTFDLQKAEASDSAMVDSKIISGAPARYEVNNFRKKIAKLMGMLQVAQERIEVEAQNAVVRVGNLEDEISELEAEIESETGDLMRHVLSKKPLRTFKFNASNRILQNITGKETGGVRNCIATIEDGLVVFDLLTGVCMSHGVGEKQNQAREFENRRGHRKTISCVFYTANRLYTGDMDACLAVWEVKENHFNVIHFYDHEFDEALVAIYADVNYIITSCSDCQLFIHDARTFKRLQRVYEAHFRTISCIQLDILEFATGGADGEVRLWRIVPPDPKTEMKEEKTIKDLMTLTKAPVQGLRLERIGRLRAKRNGDLWYDGHLSGVTCLMFEGHELVSGDKDGKIIIWDVATLAPVRICDVHNGPVTCLQFDTTRILSGGQDSSVNLTDIPTGQVLQRLGGHSGRILDLQFDRSRMYTVATDGTMREWIWHSRTESESPGELYHILAPGDTLRSVAIRYRVKTADIMKWNRIYDVMKLYMGQRLLIKDANTDAGDKEYQVSQKFGKLILEDTDFILGSGSVAKSKEQQMEDKKRQALAKEYFPPLLDDESEKEAEDEEEEESDDDDDESDTVITDGESDEEEEESGDDEEEED